jgi:hypothetical protein
MTIGGGRLWGGFAVLAGVGVLAALAGAGVPPLDAVTTVLPRGVADPLLAAGLGLVALVAVLATGVVALQATVFVISVVTDGRAALSRFPDVEPLVGGTVGVALLVTVAVAGTAVLGGGAGGGSLPFVSEAYGGAEDPHGVVASDQLSGASMADLTRYADADGDRLPDAWERAGETPAGVPLPDADPDHKDLYVQVSYGAGVEPLNDSEVRELERVWAGFRVANPDGRPGVDVHVVDTPPGGRLGERVAVDAGGFDEEFLLRYYGPGAMGDRACVFYHSVFGSVGGQYTGWGQAPGYFSVVEGDQSRGQSGASPRVETLTHELLHNVVGTLPGGGTHVERGWLAGQGDGFEPRLSSEVREDLNGSGFGRHPGLETQACDSPVGAGGDGGAVAGTANAAGPAVPAGVAGPASPVGQAVPPGVDWVGAMAGPLAVAAASKRD